LPGSGWKDFKMNRMKHQLTINPENPFILKILIQRMGIAERPGFGYDLISGHNKTV
jgi:hypothetical protein